MTTTAWQNTLDDNDMNADGNYDADAPTSSVDGDYALSVGGDIAALTANLSVKDLGLSAPGSTVDLSNGAAVLSVYGSITLNSSCDLTGYYYELHGAGTKTLTSNGGKAGNLTPIDITALTLADNAEIQVWGTFAATLNMGTHTLHLRGGSAPAFGTVNWSGAAKIIMSGAGLAGSGLPPVIDAGGDGMGIDQSISAQSIALTNPSSTPEFINFSTVGNFSLSGGIASCTFYGNSTSSCGGNFSWDGANMVGFPIDDVPPEINVTGTCVATNGGGTKTISNMNFSGTPLTAYDYVDGGGNNGTVIFLTSNSAPEVDAGPDQNITALPREATLAGSAEDADEDDLTFLWTKQSGAGTVNFADATDPTTVATFSADGVYVLRLTADDGTDTAYDEVTIRVDLVAPAFTNVTSAHDNGDFETDEVVDIQCVSGEALTVTGTPKLEMQFIGSTRQISYHSGSGTNTLVFRLTAIDADITTKLSYVSSAALTLNGGTIKDAAGNNVSLTLPVPGAAGSLSANKSISLNIDITEIVTPPLPRPTPGICSGLGLGFTR